MPEMMTWAHDKYPDTHKKLFFGGGCHTIGKPLLLYLWAKGSVLPWKGPWVDRLITPSCWHHGTDRTKTLSKCWSPELNAGQVQLSHLSRRWNVQQVNTHILPGGKETWVIDSSQNEGNSSTSKRHQQPSFRSALYNG